MQCYICVKLTFLLRSTADGKWMPLIFGNSRNIDKNIVTRVEIKVVRALNDEVCHSRRKQQSRADVCFTTF